MSGNIAAKSLNNLYIMIIDIFTNIILSMFINILSSWIYDSIKEKRYQNAILLMIEGRVLQPSFLHSLALQ